MARKPPEAPERWAEGAPDKPGAVAAAPPVSVEALYAEAVANDERPLLVIGPAGRPLVANETCAKLLGYESSASLLAVGHAIAEPAGRSTPTPVQGRGAGIASLVFRAGDGSLREIECQLRDTRWHGRPARLCRLMDVVAAEPAFRTGINRHFHPQRVGYSVTTPDKRIVDVNDNLCAILGYSREELLSLSWAEITHPQDVQANVELFERALKGEIDDYSLEKRFVCKDGTVRHLRITAHCVRSRDRKADHFMVGYEDITERILAEESLRVSEQRFKGFADAAADYFWELDENLRVTYLSERFEEITGIPPSKLIGRTRSEGFREYMDQPKKWDKGEAVMLAQRPYSMEFTVKRADGSQRVLRTTGKPFYDRDGAFRGYRGAGTDVTEMNRLAHELSYRAHHDALTGLQNRHTFEERLQRALNSSEQTGAEHALCYMDLDQFKVINDTCGHVAGDELLRQLGARLREHVRSRDTLARLGGDEFGVLLEHCGLERARSVAENLRRVIEDYRFLWAEMSFSVGVSIGLVPITGEGQTAGDILRIADTACYAAKEMGRNRIHVYHPADADLVKRHGEMQWVTRIKHALEENRLQLAMQPIVPVAKTATEKLHFEVLLRMQERDGTLIAPGAFLPAAERYGLSTRIDRWVVGAVFDWLARNEAYLDRVFLCSLNLSGHSLTSSELFDDLNHLFRHSIVPAEKICLEITETAAISNLTAAGHFIQEVRNRGCRIALDDFGSGLSSFAYLKNLPVDFVKIDGVFVKDILDDPIDFGIVKSINEIAQITGTRTIAEFVESSAILDRVRAIGVDYAQGYGIGRPRPLDEVD